MRAPRPIGYDTSCTLANQFAAMPSLHIGWSLWCATAVYPKARRWWTKALAVAYPIITLLCIVITANHFFLDALGGLLIFSLGVLIATPLTRWVQDWLVRRAAARTGCRGTKRATRVVPDGSRRPHSQRTRYADP
jgi:membrane-associated phospholipid phosphatase